MIVVGSTHMGWLGRLAPGSTAERLLPGAPCPVAIAPEELRRDWTLRRVGVGFVDLDDGRAALRYGAALAASAGASLRAVTAVSPPDWSRSAAVAPSEGAGGLEATQAAARRALHVASESVPAGVATTTDVVVAHAADALIGLSGQVDLIVCGARGHGRLPSAVLGSITRRLTRTAACPVVIVPHGVERSLSVLAGSSAAGAR
jgi:nucleotide-binding universal stress UspA family protein